MKALANGFIAATAATVLWIIGNLLFPIAFAMTEAWVTGAGGGIAGGSVDGLSVLVVAVIAFFGGVFWTIRKHASSA